MVETTETVEVETVQEETAAVSVSVNDKFAPCTLHALQLSFANGVKEVYSEGGLTMCYIVKCKIGYLNIILKITKNVKSGTPFNVEFNFYTGKSNICCKVKNIMVEQNYIVKRTRLLNMKYICYT